VSMSSRFELLRLATYTSVHLLSNLDAD